MKTKIMVILLILFINGISFAQELYMKANVGYNFPIASVINSDMSGNYLTYNTTLTQNSSSNSFTINYDASRLSLGKGLPINLSIGHLINKNIGIELGCFYLFGIKTEFTKTTNYTNGAKRIETFKFKGNMVGITPSMVIESGYEKINPYSRFGFLLAFPTFTTEYTKEFINSSNADPSFENQDEIWKYYKGISLGFNSSFGVSFKLTDKINIFSELNIVVLSYAPKKGKQMKNILNSVDRMPLESTFEKEEIYENNLTINESDQVNQNEPYKRSRFNVPFSSFGSNIGIKIKL